MATRKPTTTEPKDFGEVPENVDLNMLITVKNGFHDMLVYVSPRTGEEYIWNEYGDEQDLELKELRSIKSTKKDFFINNYFMFDDEFAWVIKYLGLTKYYEHAIDDDGFDKLLNGTPAQIKRTIVNMSDGQKKTLFYGAKAKIDSGEIDSMKTIQALEEALGVELIER